MEHNKRERILFAITNTLASVENQFIPIAEIKPLAEAIIERIDEIEQFPFGSCEFPHATPEPQSGPITREEKLAILANAFEPRNGPLDDLESRMFLASAVLCELEGRCPSCNL
jgi:hypothetical protein